MNTNISITTPYFFDLRVIMDSEQCPASYFFWQREGSDTYSRAYRFEDDCYKVKLRQVDNNLLVELIPQIGGNILSSHFNHARSQIEYQFRFEDDFQSIEEKVNQWPQVAQIFKLFPGLRLMRDVSLFDRVCDSICSQNTSIQQLNRMVGKLAQKFGENFAFEDGTSVNFLPPAEAIASANLEDIKDCGLGYRAQYLLESAKALVDRSQWQDITNQSREDAETKIRTLPGVGPKVGSLILTYGFGRTDVFAVDVWVQRGVAALYGWQDRLEKLKERGETLFGDCSAYVNNYIFYAFRKGLLDTNH